jgi:hypothetical protein
VTVVVNFTINPAYTGSYAVMEQVNYLSGVQGPWQNAGSLVVEAPPSLNPAPTVTLTDMTQSSGSYFAGDSFTLTVTGPASPANLPVSESVNGVFYGAVGYINSGGTFTIPGSWAAADISSYAEIWYVDGVQAGPALLFSVLPPLGSGGGSNPSMTGSYTATPPVSGCSDITGNWIASYGNTNPPGYQAEWDLVQNADSTVQGTLYAPTVAPCSTVLYGGIRGAE